MFIRYINRWQITYIITIYEQLFIYRKNSRLSQLSKKQMTLVTVSMIQYKYLISTNKSR
nr:MAG TPA: hypothetical protein [Caudoviricetes sp.]